MAGDRPDEVASNDTPTATRTGDRRLAPVEPVEPPGRGSIVGRYLILSVLGRGGMGVVYAAHDPELDRRVALKLVLPGSASGAEAHARLLREAQALARLADPNVVAIHDVGTHAGSVWLAMEHIEGCTLRAWSKQRPRPWTEVLDVMTAAARGVAAAHRAGLLHRDLKPENIMVGNDGRVRVMDLGLARITAAGDGPQVVVDVDVDAPTQGAGGNPVLAAPMTRIGALVGTPRYMAPEQFAGTEIGEATDQFALCITLWEALFDERPFVGATVLELAANVIAGRVRPPSDPSRAPAWLRRICERGLAPTPRDRFASIESWLAAIAGAHARRRRWRAVATLGAVSAVVGSIALVRAWQDARTVDGCTTEGAAINEVWNDDARARVRAGFVGTGLAYGESSAAAVATYLDAYAAAWSTASTEACLDTHARGVWDDERLDRARWCLGERRMGLGALVGELADSDAGALPLAIDAAAGLAPIAPCRDAQRLLALPPPPADRKAVGEVLRTIARADALEAAARYDAALVIAEQARVSASDLGWPPVAVAARLRIGALLEHIGRWEAAREELQEVYLEAAMAGEQEIAADAAMMLARIVGFHFMRRDDGLLWGRLADVALAAIHEPAQSPRRALALDYVAHVHWAAGEFERARELNQRSLEIREAVLGPHHPEVARSLDYLANAHAQAHQLERARTLLERARGIRERTLGADHPSVAGSLMAIASIDAEQGHPDDAVVAFGHAVEILEGKLGREHPNLAPPLTQLAQLAIAQGRAADALPLAERALRLLERTGSGPVQLAPTQFVLAQAIIEGPDASAEERARARTLARAAQQALAVGQEPEAADIATWLARTDSR